MREDEEEQEECGSCIALFSIVIFVKGCSHYSCKSGSCGCFSWRFSEVTLVVMVRNLRKGNIYCYNVSHYRLLLLQLVNSCSEYELTVYPLTASLLIFGKCRWDPWSPVRLVVKAWKSR